jgi:homocysteine S-methyltransferase
MTQTRLLPHQDGRLYLTDGGFETTLIFHEGWDLPMGEAFVLLESKKGRKAIRDYFDRYLPIAVEHGTGFVLESPTWRANPDWAAKVGYGRDRLAELNHNGIELMREVRGKYESPHTPILISGNIGPRGDGYDPGKLMTPKEATDYHY